MTLFSWTFRRVLAVSVATPALAIGYIVTWLLIVHVHYQTVGVLSSVFIGDISAFIFGQATQDYQYRFMLRFKSFREIMPQRKSPKSDTPQKFIKRRFLSFLTLFPPMAFNYLAVFVLISFIHFHTVWILSAVLVGDGLGFAFNSLTLDYQFKFLMHFESFKELLD
jgi:hypothetical protein